MQMDEANAFKERIERLMRAWDNILSVKRVYSPTLKVNGDEIKDCFSWVTTLILDDIVIDKSEETPPPPLVETSAACTLFYGEKDASRVAPFVCLSLGCSLLDDKVIMTILLHEDLHILKVLKGGKPKTQMPYMIDFEEEMDIILGEMDIYDELGVDFKRAFIKRQMQLSKTIQQWMNMRTLTPLRNREFSNVLLKFLKESNLVYQGVNVIRLHRETR